MTFINPKPWLVGRIVDGIPVYYRSYREWVPSPKKATHLNRHDAEQVILGCVKKGILAGAIVRIDEALRLFRIQEIERRGDIRSLPSPDGAGVPTLTARPLKS